MSAASLNLPWFKEAYPGREKVRTKRFALCAWGFFPLRLEVRLRRSDGNTVGF
jgi:hypothetical protein